MGELSTQNDTMNVLVLYCRIVTFNQFLYGRTVDFCILSLLHVMLLCCLFQKTY